MKKSISFIVLLIILFSIIITPMMVYADTNLDIVTAIVDKANTDIQKEVMKAQRDVDTYIKVNLEGKISERIEDLIEVTDEISEKTIKKAAEYGIEVECEYIEVDIGGTTVLIDPLRIVGV